MSVSVHLIHAWSGPRHKRCENIWRRYMARHPEAAFVVLEARGRTHEQSLEAEWAAARRRPERVAIFSEFDFLPGEGFLDEEPESLVCAEFLVRDPKTCEIHPQGTPGAWFVRVDKEKLGPAPLDFSPGGVWNDPGAKLTAPDMRLIPPEDCWPRHYGVEVGDKGTHCFWSRHYNWPPIPLPCGFHLADIHRGVDDALDEYECLNR